MTDLVTARIFAFGDFLLDVGADELRRGADAIKLQRVPMDILVMLVARAGDIVTRHEIVDKVWGRDASIDVEASVNTAMRKLRRALQDDADHPSYVQTIPAKGYQFIAEVTCPDESMTPESARNRRRILLAVLPFEHINAASDDEYFANGLTEEAITALGRVRRNTWPSSPARRASLTKARPKESTRSAPSLASIIWSKAPSDARRNGFA